MKTSLVKKRRFEELRQSILSHLVEGTNKTVNQISQETGINWKTVDNHLIYLTGRGWVKNTFSSPYVKIFEITDKGKEQINGGAG